MVLRQICKDAHIQRQSPNSFLLQRMAGHLHHRLRRPHCNPIRKHTQRIRGLRRRMLRHPHLIPHMRLNRPDQHTLPPYTPQHLLQQQRRRRLPIRPGHRTQRELAFRMSQHSRTHLGESTPPVLHQRRTHSRMHAPQPLIRLPRVCHHRSRTLRYCSLYIVVAVRHPTAHRNKAIPTLHPSRVILHPQHVCLHLSQLHPPDIRHRIHPTHRVSF